MDAHAHPRDHRLPIESSLHLRSRFMETLADRAAQSLTRHPAPALPIDELTEQVRGGGVAVGAGVLLRALEARPDLFRVLDPWRGPWRSAARPAGQDTRWVVSLGRSTLDRDPRARLKASVVHLGRTLDERSVTSLARWLGMVREMSGAERYAPSRTNQAERQSPSASTSISAKPA
jgi:hypothetical protein